VVAVVGTACDDAAVTDSSYPLRTATADDYDEFRRVFGAALMFDVQPDETGKAVFEPDRALVATDGDEVVGTAKAMSRDLSVPGAVVPAAHVTAVGVRATHRRRGILSDLMTRQLREVPEAIAVLWASESAIYGRFGYAPAAWMTTYEIDLHRVRPKPVTDSGRLREIPAEDAGQVLAPLLADLQRSRPGVSGRSALEWVRRLDDPAERREGKTTRRIIVHSDETGTVDGYLLWRGKLKFDTGGPASEVHLEELVAVEPAAYAALWHHVLTMDLAARLHFDFASLQEPVQQLVSNADALNRKVLDSLWVRITDVARALEQRRYATAVDVVLEITDELLPDNNGRFRLVGDTEKARCERTDDAADLALSVTELGAAYLGGRSLTEYAVTGRVKELTPGTLASTATAFSWPISPSSIEIF
jgi:predicted acetyltransferase